MHQNWSKAHDWPVKNDIVASLPIKLKKKIDTLGSRGSLADIRGRTIIGGRGGGGGGNFVPQEYVFVIKM